MDLIKVLLTVRFGRPLTPPWPWEMMDRRRVSFAPRRTREPMLARLQSQAVVAPALAPGPGKAPVDRRGGDDRCAAVRWAARRADVGAPPAGFARGGPASQGLTPGRRGGP